MTERFEERGTIEYTARGFEQDTQEAMGGRIEKALVELVTNADDSYAELEGQGSRPSGAIRIEVEHRRKGKPWKVIVRDRAEGMTAQEMKAKLRVLGVEASGFREGRNVRGLLGRGAKDVAAFGKVTWEAIKDGKYYLFTLGPSGDYGVRSFQGEPASQEVQERLGILRGNGTVVTIDVAGRFDCPRHDTLKQRLQRYFSLRDIMSAPDRKVL